MTSSVHSSALEAIVLGGLTLLLLVGGGAAAAHFAASRSQEATLEGSFSASRRADYGSAGEQPIAPQAGQRLQITPTVLRSP